MTVEPSTLARIVPAAFLIAAAFAKAFAPGDGSMWVWLGITPSLRGLITILLVCLEAGLGASMLFFLKCRPLAWLFVAMMLAFSILLTAMMLSQHPPTCNCLGAFQLFRNQRQELAFGIARNLLLIGSVLWSLDAPSTKPPLKACLNAN